MSPDDIPLLFHTSSHTSQRVDREELRGFLDQLTRRIARGRTITCLIANDAEVRRLNREFRGKNQATDVLSFPPACANGVAGDIATAAITVNVIPKVMAARPGVLTMRDISLVHRFNPLDLKALPARKH